MNPNSWMEMDSMYLEVTRVFLRSMIRMVENKLIQMMTRVTLGPSSQEQHFTT